MNWISARSSRAPAPQFTTKRAPETFAARSKSRMPSAVPTSQCGRAVELEAARLAPARAPRGWPKRPSPPGTSAAGRFGSWSMRVLQRAPPTAWSCASSCLICVRHALHLGLERRRRPRAPCRGARSPRRRRAGGGAAPPPASAARGARASSVQVTGPHLRPRARRARPCAPSPARVLRRTASDRARVARIAHGLHRPRASIICRISELGARHI